MDKFAKAYASIILADNLVIKTLAIREVAQMAKIEVRLREYLGATWKRRTAQASKKAIIMARQLKPHTQIASAIGKIMDGWGKEVLPAFHAETKRTYDLGREVAHKKATRQTSASLRYPIQERPETETVKKAVVAANIRPSFDLADADAVAALKNHQTFWIGKHYKERISPSIAETTRTVMAEAGQDSKIAGALMAKRIENTLSHVKVPGGFMGTAPQYFEGLTANAMTVARVHGQIRSFMDIGITTYRITNPNDKRTCPRCAHLDGKTFKTKQGASQMQRELAAKKPEDVKAAHPWLSLKELERISPSAGALKGKAAEADSKALADSGQALPPYHFKCRCTVDIGTDSLTYESLEPLTAPIPGKPIVPKFARFKSISAWKKSLTKEEIAGFNAWTGQDFWTIKLADQVGKKAAKKKYPKEVKWLEGIQSALKKAPVYKGRMYRGMYDLDAATVKKFTTPGNIVQQEALTSWSADEGIALGAGELTTSKGGNAIVMEVEALSRKGNYDVTIMGIDYESELLSEKGKRFKVWSVKKRAGENGMGEKITVYHVKYREM